MRDKNSSAQSDSLDQEGTGLGPEDEELVRRYLLSELTEQEQQQVEERLMTDDEYYNQVLMAEDELIDEYVSGELTGRERERFKYSFLTTPEGQQDVSFSKALREYASKATVTERPQSPTSSAERVSWWDSLVALLRPQGSVVRWSLAAVAVLLLVGSAWLVIEVRRLQNELNQLQAKQTALQGNEQELQQQLVVERARKDQLAEELRRQQEQRASLEQELARLKNEQRGGESASKPEQLQRPVIALTIPPGLDRASGTTYRLRIPSGEEWVRIKLVLSGDSYTNYRAALEPVGGGSQSMFKARRIGSSKSIILRLPTSILSRGDYQIKLSGVSASGESEEVGTYYFRVVEQ